MKELRSDIKKEEFNMDEENRAVDVYENEPTANGKLKVFGIIAIVLGVAKLVARLVIYLHFDIVKVLQTSPNSEKLIKSLEENNYTLEQVANALKGMIITYSVVGFIVLLIIGILAIRGASTGKVKGLFVLLIIYLVYTVLSLLFSFGVHSVIGVFGIITVIVAIIGIVFTNKVRKQQ